MEIQHYLTILRERWRSALVTALALLAAVVGYTLLQTPTYQATNRSFVQTDAGSTVADLNSGVNFASQQITSYADLATTPLVLDPVIDELNLDVSPQSLATRISTTVPPDTLILDITVSSEDPAEAATIANATAESLRDQVTALESNGEGSTVELTVISPATEPASPASPNIPRNVAVGLALGLMAGAGVAILRELLDNRVRRAEDIQRSFDRTVLGAIPATRDSEHLPLIAVREPHSLAAEAYRELRTNLQFMGVSSERKSVLITSSVSGEGKSSSAINLAHVLAQSGIRVLLIDADLRRPSVHKYLSLEGSVGLTTVLIGDAEFGDVVHPLETEGLDVLTSGQLPPNPSELLGSERMERLLTTVTADYDFVVVDTAPLLAVTDAAILSRIVGGTVLVARSEHVKTTQLAQALEKLEAVDARILGVLLNRVHIASRDAYTYTQESGPAAQRTVAKATAVEVPTSAGTVPAVDKPHLPARAEPRERARRRRSAKKTTGAFPDFEPSTEPRTWPSRSTTDVDAQ